MRKWVYKVGGVGLLGDDSSFIRFSDIVDTLNNRETALEGARDYREVWRQLAIAKQNDLRECGDKLKQAQADASAYQEGQQHAMWERDGRPTWETVYALRGELEEAKAAERAAVADYGGNVSLNLEIDALREELQQAREERERDTHIIAQLSTRAQQAETALTTPATEANDG